MKKRFFIKHLTSFLSPLLILFIMFGVPSIILTWNYSTKEMNKFNSDLMMLIKENIEYMLSETTFLTNSLNENVNNLVELKELFYNSEYSYENFHAIKNITSILNSPANVREHIQSVYVYIDNPYSRCMVSNLGMVDLEQYPDHSWYDSYTQTDSHINLWSERRQINLYSFQEEPIEVLSLYNRLNRASGVIVLNIYTKSLSKLLENMGLFPGQCIAVITDDGQTVFSTENVPDIEIEKLISLGDTNGKNITIGNQQYIATILTSQYYGWYYVSLVPIQAAYKVPIFLISFMSMAAMLAVTIGVYIAIRETRKNYVDLNKIIEMFTSAEAGKDFPDSNEDTRDEYALISQNIMKSFIVHNNLKIQFERQQFERKSTELLALQSQLNPHFLFNTLECINLEVLAKTRKPSPANKMISDLSSILRYSLGLTHKPVTVQEEVENTKRYINILYYRYENKLDVRWNYSDEVLQFPIMRLAIQPLVENAVIHGLKSGKEQIVIRISIKNKGNFLQITVLDTGAGINRAQLEELRFAVNNFEKDHHIGLNNTNRRLILTYGDTAGLQIFSRPGIGTSVSFKIPLQ